MTLAKATMSGQVLTEPEKWFTPNNTAVTNFNIQVTPTGRNETPFVVRVACWRALADTVAEQVHKGMMVTVDGRLQVNSFEEQGGLARRMYEIDASNVYLGQLEMLSTQAADGFPRNSTAGMTPPSGGGMGQPQPQAQPAYTAPQPVAAAAASPMAPQESYDDIPF